MGARDIATNAISQLRSNVQAGMAERGKNATGNTSQRIDVLAFGSDNTGEAAMEADSHWKFVGNGRAPGGRPPIAKLRQWIQARGLSISPYALANKIAAEGSMDYRLGRTNVFLDEITEWENNDLPQAEDLFAAEMEMLGLKTIDEVQFS